jgi:hypothetical protein
MVAVRDAVRAHGMLITKGCPTVGGMSGSPILAEDCTAVGIVCLGSNMELEGPHPRLMGNLPGWFLAMRTSLEENR